MALSDFLLALPEDKREAYRAEVEATEAKLAKAVFIETKEDAQKLVDTNDLLKRINQADRDQRYAAMVAEFEKTKLPAMLEAERAKGQKQPWELEIEKLKAENDAAKKEAALEKQRARGSAKASELGIPASLVDRFIGLTDEETDAALKTLAETILPFRDEAVKQALVKVGAQPAPKGGSDKGADLNALSPTERLTAARAAAMK